MGEPHVTKYIHLSRIGYDTELKATQVTLGLAYFLVLMLSFFAFIYTHRTETSVSTTGMPRCAHSILHYAAATSLRPISAGIS